MNHGGGGMNYKCAFLANRNLKNCLKLDFVALTRVHNESVAFIDEVDVKEEIDYWKYALVGGCMGDTP